MKRILLLIMFCVLIVSNVEAKPYKHHRSHRGYHVANVAAGIVGTTAGILLAEELMSMRRYNKPLPKPRIYMVEPEEKCYTVVFRKTGKISQQCVENSSDDIIYVD